MNEFKGSLCVKDRTKEKYFMLNIAVDGYFLVNEKAQTVFFKPDELYDLFEFWFSKLTKIEEPKTHVCAYSGIEFPIKN